MGNGDMQKRDLITGCSSGFGLLTVVEAVKAGFDCIVTMRNMAKADYLRQALKQAGASATIEQLDVTDAESIQTIAFRYAPIDILVNNAGILIMGSVLDITEEEMWRVFETNYFGAVWLTRADRQKARYVIGKDAKLLTIAKWLGLTSFVENYICKYLIRATRRENRRAQAKKEAGGRKTENR